MCWQRYIAQVLNDRKKLSYKLSRSKWWPGTLERNEISLYKKLHIAVEIITQVEDRGNLSL